MIHRDSILQQDATMERKYYSQTNKVHPKFEIQIKYWRQLEIKQKTQLPALGMNYINSIDGDQLSIPKLELLEFALLMADSNIGIFRA